MKYNKNSDYVGEHSEKNGYYIPQARVGEEFKTLEIPAPVPILTLTTSERIGEICASEKEKEIRRIEEIMEQTESNTALAKKPKISI